MYAVAITRDFVAKHRLIGGDWGEENRNHSHQYKVELQLEGEDLDCHGFLVDIVDLEAQLDAQVRYYADRTLNDLPEFAGLNPSIERFALIMCDMLSARINAPTVRVITVKIWENDNAWASHSRVKQSSA
jgi:6-pyruvoyltetrahydropterin/6-carboxytetrahydropterin synthase